MDFNPSFILGITQMDVVHEVDSTKAKICNESEQCNRSTEILQVGESPKIDEATDVRQNIILIIPNQC